MRRSSFVTILLGASALAMPLAAQAQTASAAAQTESSATPPASDAPATSDTDEIVVTAQKRAENAQQVPISIQAFGGAQLAQAAVFSPADLQRIAPSFKANSSIGTLATRFAIRGVGSFGNSAIEPSVATFFDGIYIPRPASIVNSLLDIEAVEVLSGPQGTLFGRNASVGAVSYRTGSVKDEFGAGLKVDATTGNRIRTEGFVNIPLSDDTAVRVALLGDKFDGYWHDDLLGGRFGGIDTFSGRVSLKTNLTDSLVWTVRAEGQDNTGDGTINTKVLAGTYTPTTLARITTLQGGIAPEIGYGTHNNSYNLGNKVDDSTFSVRSDLSFTTDGDFTFRLLDGYFDWDSNQSDGDTAALSTYVLGRNLFYDSKSDSHELQFVSPKDKLLDGKLDFVAGLYYFNEDLGIRADSLNGTAFCSTLVPLAGLPFGAIIPGATTAAKIATCQGYANPSTSGDFDQNTKSYAAYGQATFEVVPKVELTGGVRYTDEKKRASYVGTVFNPTGAILAANETTALNLNDHHFTYRANVAWKPTSDLMLFGTYSTGFKSGGFNNGIATVVLGQQRVFQAETVKNYEAGVKSQFFDRMLTLNATAFRMDINNFQERSVVNTTSTIRNVGALRQQGVEMEGIARPTDWLRLNAAATYLDSKFRSYPNAPRAAYCPAGLAVATAFCPATSSAATGGVQDLTGTSALTYSPKWTIVAGATVTGVVGSTGFHWVLNGDANYVSKQRMGTQIDNNPIQIQKGYTLLNARLTINGPEDRYSIGVFGRNLANKGYCGVKVFQVLEGPLGLRYDLNGDGVNDGTLTRCLVGAPRVIGATAGFKF